MLNFIKSSKRIKIKDLAEGDTFRLLKCTTENQTNDILLVLANPRYNATSRAREEMEQGKKLMLVNLTQYRLTFLSVEHEIIGIHVDVTNIRDCEG